MSCREAGLGPSTTPPIHRPTLPRSRREGEGGGDSWKISKIEHVRGISDENLAGDMFTVSIKNKLSLAKDLLKISFC